MHSSNGSLPFTVLDSDFMAQSPVSLSRALLGQYLYCQPNDQSVIQKPTLLKIVETEAYTQDDPACHAYQKTNGRAKVLYEGPGTAYVYFIYGMHYCFNVVCGPKGYGAAVLIRALEPLSNSELKTHGPARLCKSLGIRTDTHNGLCLLTEDNPVVLLQGEPPEENKVVVSTRIGISKAKDYPWRFSIKDNLWVRKTLAIAFL